MGQDSSGVLNMEFWARNPASSAICEAVQPAAAAVGCGARLGRICCCSRSESSTYDSSAPPGPPVGGHRPSRALYPQPSHRASGRRGEKCSLA